MRDPWFPIALILIVLFGSWLAIIGPLPGEVSAWIAKWQTLLGTGTALLAASIAVRNTNRSIQHASELETNRRRRKQSALRAAMPIALAQLSDYAERSARNLGDLVNQCVNEALPQMVAKDSHLESPPNEALKAFADFIEYSDAIDVAVIEATTAWLQIHNSRVRTLIKDNRDPSGSRSVVRAQLEASMIDAASIYAGAASAYDYARRREAQLPHSVRWDAVGRALNNMGFWEDDYPRLHAILAAREKKSAGPFESLNTKIF
jgi:hypothetical protein